MRIDQIEVKLCFCIAVGNRIIPPGLPSFPYP